MADYNLQTLSHKLGELMHYCKQLRRDNDELTRREKEWLLERDRLNEKNELARVRVEAMIHQLKSLADSSDAKTVKSEDMDDV